MIKLSKILKEELKKPSNIYASRDGKKELSYLDLTPEEKEELFKKGSILVPIKDPNRPDASASQVINLPKLDQIKRDIIRNKKDFDVFMFSTDPMIQNIAQQINNHHNKLYRLMNALEKSLSMRRR